MAPPPLRRVSADELRRMFNDGGYWQRVQTGELQQCLRQDRHPTSPVAPEPYCTRSQLVSYLDADEVEEIARVFHYLRADGTIGASGRPDPKRLFVNGVVYALE